jgi:serine/threonine protein kinase
LDPTKHDHTAPHSRELPSDLKKSNDTKTRNYHPRLVVLYGNQYNIVTTRVVSLHIPEHKQRELELATNQTSKAPHLQHNNGTQEEQYLYVDEDGNVQKIILQVEDKADDKVQETLQDVSDKCLAMADWQTQSFVNCNSLHEIDLHRGITHVHDGTAQLTFLGQGRFRDTWQVGSDNEEPVVLKTLRMEREFLEEYYERHRRDAVAMERLTHSHFVMNVFGYCGQSALNELANNIRATSLDKLDRRFMGGKRRKGISSAVLLLKLRLATSIAVGVSHVHEVKVEDINSGLSFPAGMVHCDLNPYNIAITRGGKPKLNDFNLAEFLR